jgi:AcrR family transcriptional regulator
MSSATSGRSGRRRGTTQTREAIAEAARTQFAQVGYERATMRSIASAAGVDPALIVHFFGSKEALFRDVMALPPQLAQLFGSIAAAPRDEVGRRLAEAVVGSLENPATRSIVLGRIRSSATHPDAVELVRELVSRDMAFLTSALTDDRQEIRARLVGVQVVGLAFVRYVVGIEPLASMPPAEVVDLLAPIFQRLLVEPLAD